MVAMFHKLFSVPFKETYWAFACMLVTLYEARKESHTPFWLRVNHGGKGRTVEVTWFKGGKAKGKK